MSEVRVCLTAVCDDLSGFSAPQQVPSIEYALRSFRDAVHDTALLSSHAKDFSLWLIGDYDLNTGEIVPEHRLLVRAVDILNDGGTE